MIMKRNRLIRKIRTTNSIYYIRLILFIGLLGINNIILGQNGSEAVDSSQFVTGIVRDAKTKEPIAAAQIKSLNYESAAVTDENGAFEINIISKNEVLLVRAFDYNTIEFPIRGRQNLEIELYKEIFTDLYPEINGINTKIRSSYSVNPVNEISELGNPTMVSVDEIIHSHMSGNVRTMTRSGLCGIGSSLFIRGYNSLNLNAQPLFVVDGVIWDNHMDIISLHSGYYTNPLANIDYNDIESITVIKDGTSLYGSKGSNGVILVKSKRGVDAATRITFNAVGGITESPAQFPLMNGDQFRIYSTDLLGTMEISPAQYNEMGFLNDDPSALDYLKYHNSTNWENEVYQRGTFQSYNVSVNGGDERALYAFSIGYTGNKGIVDLTDMQRLNTRFNADFFLSNKISMDLNIGFTNIDRNLLDDGVNFYTSPTYLAMIKAEFLSPYTYTTAGELTSDFEDEDDFDVGNPRAIIENSLNSSKQYRLNMSIKPIFQLSPSLTLSSLFDYSRYKIKEAYYKPIIGSAPQVIPGIGISENVFKNQQVRDNSFFNDTRLQYKSLLGNNHHVNSIIGLRYLYNSINMDYAEGHNSGSDQKRNLLYEEEFKYTIGENSEIKSLSYFVNLDYSYDKRYFLSLTLSADGSSRFGREAQGGFQLFNKSWGLFPSANAAWLISSESFMSGVAIINLLKLRGGYGISGNDAIDPYAWTAYFESIRYIDRANGLYIANIGNSEIQWETSTKMNFGIDMILLNNRLSLSADVYKNNTKDLLQLKALPDIAGSGYYWNNGGELSNTGFEFNTNIKILNLNSLKWELGASMGQYKNRIVSLPDGDFTTTFYGAEILTSVNNPAGVFYGYKTNGVFASEAEAETANLKMINSDGLEHYFGAGDVHFVDLNTDGTIDENDKQIIGDPNPDFYGSFNSKVAFRNFTLDALFTFSYGIDVYNHLRAELESGHSFMNQTTAMLKRWTHEGQETDQPKVYYDDPMGNARFSDRWIEDGSYLRLKTLSLNYRIPIRSSIIEQINLWFSANNLITWTNYLGRDPDVSANNFVLYQGIDIGLIPSGRSYYIGIKLNL